MNRLCFAAVPCNHLEEAKSRLRPVLAADSRKQLVLNLLRHTIDVLTSVGRSLDRIIVVTPDPQVHSLLSDRAVSVFPDPPSANLNEALSAAATWAAREGANRFLILPIDLPRLTVEDVNALLAVPGQAISPDRSLQGTNAMLVDLPLRLQLHFGPHSFPRHCSDMSDFTVLKRPSLAFDIDMPDDYRACAAELRATFSTILGQRSEGPQDP